MLKWLLLIALLLYLLGRRARMAYEADGDYDEVHYAKTDDGVLLALFHYAPETPDPDKLPVVCCHGFTENHRIYDLPGRSLPRFLNARGFDVWVLELRGSDASRRTASGAPFDWRYGIDDHIRRDLPAAIGYVTEKTGKDRVHWIGHSMGGMVLYGYLARGDGADRIARAATLSSPGAFSAKMGAIRYAAALAPHLRGLRRLHILFWYSFWLFLAEVGLVRPPMMANRRNLTGRTYMHLAVNAYSDTSMQLSADFARCLSRERFVSGEDGFDYEGNLPAIQTPILAAGGEADSLLPPGHVKRVYEQLGSDEKRFVVFGPRNGQREGYGHCDLTLGDHAPEEVWPVVADWLEGNAADASQSSEEGSES